MAVLFQTSLGEFTVDLFIKEVPLLACNILKLCKVKYYNNSLFHCVEKDFLARGGLVGGESLASDCASMSVLSLIRKHDPEAFEQCLVSTRNRYVESEAGAATLEGTEVSAGNSVSSFNFPYNISQFDNATGLLHESTPTKLRHSRRGIFGMANSKSNEIGSSFYITLRDSISYLDNKRSIVGVVAEGLDVLDKLNNVLVEDPTSSRPLRPVRIFHTIVLDDPFPDPPGLQVLVPASSPIQVTDEDVEPDSSLTGRDAVEAELLQLERTAKLEAKSRSVALEVLGDLPDADLAPPDNILFVCKLNPVTESSDLQLIFSRFGEILSCEVIRDWKTGDSLQYAFVEFATRDSCERAYFKMEGCLIDDRRIHVDFCQSVAKKWNQFRRQGHRRRRREAGA